MGFRKKLKEGLKETVEFESGPYRRRLEAMEEWELAEEQKIQERISAGGAASIGVGAGLAVFTGGISLIGSGLGLRRVDVAEQKLTIAHAIADQRGWKRYNPTGRDLVLGGATSLASLGVAHGAEHLVAHAANAVVSSTAAHAVAPHGAAAIAHAAITHPEQFVHGLEHGVQTHEHEIGALHHGAAAAAQQAHADAVLLHTQALYTSPAELAGNAAGQSLMLTAEETVASHAASQGTNLLIGTVTKRRAAGKKGSSLSSGVSSPPSGKHGSITPSPASKIISSAAKSTVTVTSSTLANTRFGIPYRRLIYPALLVLLFSLNVSRILASFAYHLGIITFYENALQSASGPDVFRVIIYSLGLLNAISTWKYARWISRSSVVLRVLAFSLLSLHYFMTLGSVLFAIERFDAIFAENTVFGGLDGSWPAFRSHKVYHGFFYNFSPVCIWTVFSLARFVWRIWRKEVESRKIFLVLCGCIASFLYLLGGSIWKVVADAAHDQMATCETCYRSGPRASGVLT